MLAHCGRLQPSRWVVPLAGVIKSDGLCVLFAFSCPDMIADTLPGWTWTAAGGAEV
jgi:hypothetical protein